MGRANQEENSIEELMFADDMVLMAEDQIILREMVSELDQRCRKYGMGGGSRETGRKWFSPAENPFNVTWNWMGRRLDRLSNSGTWGVCLLGRGDAERMSRRGAWGLLGSFASFHLC